METIKKWIKEKSEALNMNKEYAQKHNDKTLLQVLQGKIDILNEFEKQIIQLEKIGEN